MLSLLSAVALAVPMQLSHQGRVLDQATGAPLTTNHDLTFRIYNVATGGTALWTETLTVPFDEGYYTATLGTDTVNNALEDTLFDQSSLYLGVAVDGGTELSPRTVLVAVPYAIKARNVGGGGVVDAAEVRVNGNVVIDGSGTVVAPSAGTELDDLGCGADQVPLFDGSNWTCTGAGGVPDWDDMVDIPADLADGTIDWAELANIPTDLVDGRIDWTSIDGLPAHLLDGDVAWTELIGIPVDLEDGRLDWASLDNLPTDLADGTIAWTELTGIPGDIADGDDTLSEAAVEGFIENGGLDLAGGLTTASDVGVGTPTPAATLDVAGGIRLSTFATCSPSTEGTLRYESSTATLELCDGAAWAVLNAPVGSQQGAPGTTCLDIQNRGGDVGDGTYWIDPNGGSPADSFQVYCDMTTLGGGWTTCGKFDRDSSGTNYLTDGFARSAMNRDDIADIATFSGGQSHASMDCRDLVLAGATRVLSAGTDSVSAGFAEGRIVNLPAEVVADPTNLWDLALDETGTRNCTTNVFDTFDLNDNPLGATDGGANLSTRRGILGDGAFWTDDGRDGAAWSNAGNDTSNCTGTANDTIYWAWQDLGGGLDDHGCASSIGELQLGTGCLQESSWDPPTYRYNLMLFR